MPTIEQVNQKLSSCLPSFSLLKDRIESLASTKSVSILRPIDTPLTVLDKINSNIIKIPTETLSLHNNGTFDCLHYKTADVYVPDPNNIGAYLLGITSEFIDTQGRVKAVGEGLFRNIQSLTTVNLPECMFVNAYAFSSCSNLSNVYLPICSYVANRAFYRCSSMVELNLPECEYIDSGVFLDCYKLNSLSLPICRAMGSWVFQGCSSLYSIYLPNLVSTSLATFQNCSYLSIASLPKCELLAEQTFWACVALSALYIGQELSFVPTLASTDVFTNTPMLNSTYLGYYGSIYVPASLVTNYKNALNWSYYSSRITAA